MLIILAAILFGPVALAVGLAVGFVGLVFSLPALIYCNTRCYHGGSLCEAFILVIACIVLAPLSLATIIIGVALGSIVLIPYGIWVFVDWCRNR
jgi:CBS-domain-containing membrane protein